MQEDPELGTAVMIKNRVVKAYLSLKELDAGFENSDFVEALSLVQPDIPVIVVGQNGLKDGARVKIVNQEEVPAAGGRETAEERN